MRLKNSLLTIKKLKFSRFKQPFTNLPGLVTSQPFDLNQHREQQLERLADCFEEHLKIDTLLQIMQSIIIKTAIKGNNL
ncbi:hypothetical protein [Thiomicrorhabdus aquaedulcis]|uniref:hypothetical protein n=1 Tax=Thiomicrorhabdus aquaedulcis TaxID=2211106 RepID=UPI000FDAB05A|nr:hypothetical protein [Thiomicrorhabdus aquaedulcis]